MVIGCDKAIIDRISGTGLVEKVEETEDGCCIVTAFTLSDHEVLPIFLEETEGGWRFSDHARTISWLCNNLLDITDSRELVLDSIMMECGTRYENGHIIRDVGDHPEDDLVQMMTAIIRMSDLVLLNRRTVRSTFLDDVKEMFEERFPDCDTGKVLSTVKGERFKVDVYVDREKPLLVFGVRTKDRCKDASIAIMALSEDTEFESVAVIDVDADIPKRDLEFLRNRAGHVMTLDEARSAQLRWPSSRISARLTP